MGEKHVKSGTDELHTLGTMVAIVPPFSKLPFGTVLRTLSPCDSSGSPTVHLISDPEKSCCSGKSSTRLASCPPHPLRRYAVASFSGLVWMRPANCAPFIHPKQLNSSSAFVPCRRTQSCQQWGDRMLPSIRHSVSGLFGGCGCGCEQICHDRCKPTREGDSNC